MPEIPSKISDETITELRAEVQRLDALVRTVDVFGTGFVWTDPVTGAQRLLHPADVAVILRVDQQTEIEKVRESAYRAGREDERKDHEAKIAAMLDIDDDKALAAEVAGYQSFVASGPVESELDVTSEAFEAAKRAGREDAARERDDQIRRAARRLVARIIANAHLLDVPFTDAPDRSPWTELKAEMYRLYGAVGIKVAVVDHQLGEDPDTPEGR